MRDGTDREQGIAGQAAGRQAEISRETGETRIRVRVGLDGPARADIGTGVGFFDHMLDLLARHAQVDLSVRAEGDLHVDAHHLVEDTGLALGQALALALGDKRGIRRYGSARIPMDEALAQVDLDLSGRPFLRFEGDLGPGSTGAFDPQLAEEFFRAVAFQAGITLHMEIRTGRNTHHIIEALFKGFARALREAASPDPRESGIPSTKGIL